MQYIAVTTNTIVKSNAPAMSDTNFESGTMWYDSFNNNIYYFFLVEKTDKKGNLIVEKHWLKLDNAGLILFIQTI